MNWILILAIAIAIVAIISAYVVWKWERQPSLEPLPPPQPPEPKPQPTFPQTDFGDLKSDVNADYTHLRDLLAAQKYKEADGETRRVMLQVARSAKQARQPFPCADLQTIDRLWVQYSDGRFGFSVQRYIYNSVDGDYEKFGDRVGWRKQGQWLNYHELTFDRQAPSGHLPRVPWVRVWEHYGWEPSWLLQRLQACKL
jgi:eukaryotic-like serine/threonine-protein kinase